jgi:uncharacterized protein (DUF4415 family)
MGKTSVKFSDIKNLPGLSDKRIAEIKAFNGVDFSDSPELTAADWRKARPAYTKISKTGIHTKIDDDILDWLKRDGKGYSKVWFNTPSNLRFAYAPAQIPQRLQRFGIKPDGIINFLSNEPPFKLTQRLRYRQTSLFRTCLTEAPQARLNAALRFAMNNGF